MTPTERQVEIVQRLSRRYALQPSDVKDRYNDQVLIDAAAGTGKTYVMGILASQIPDIYFLAPTHRAKSLLIQSLAENGVIDAHQRCFTWQSYFHLELIEEPKKGVIRTYTAPPGWNGLFPPSIHDWDNSRFEYRDVRVLVIDEASMAPEYLYSILSRFNGLVVWSGDSCQLPAIIGAHETKWSPFDLNISRYRLLELIRFRNNPAYAKQCTMVREVGQVDWIQPTDYNTHDFRQSPILCYRNNTVRRHTLQIRGSGPECAGDIIVFDTGCSPFVVPSSRYNVLDVHNVSMTGALDHIRVRIAIHKDYCEEQLKQLKADLKMHRNTYIGIYMARQLQDLNAVEVLLRLRSEQQWYQQLGEICPAAKQTQVEINKIARAIAADARIFKGWMSRDRSSLPPYDWTDARCSANVGGIPFWVDQDTPIFSRIITVDSIEFKTPDIESEDVVVLHYSLRKVFKQEYRQITKDLYALRKQVIIDAERVLGEITCEMTNAVDEVLAEYQAHKDRIVEEKGKMLKFIRQEIFHHTSWWQLLCNKWSHGLAMTVHKAQGSTFENAIVDIRDLAIARIVDPSVYSKLLYVAVSRGKRNVFDISKSFPCIQPLLGRTMTADEVTFVAYCRIRDVCLVTLIVDKKVRRKECNCFDIIWVKDVSRVVKAQRRALTFFYAIPRNGIISPCVRTLVADGVDVRFVSYKMILMHVIDAPEMLPVMIEE